MGLFDVGENNVGQFGADNSNIIRYKQAAEYAEDARLYALEAAEAIIDADNLLNRAEEILAEAKEIIDSVKDLDAEVGKLETRVTAAEAVANDAIAKAQEAINTTATIIATAKSYADASQASSQASQGFSQSAAQSAIAASNAVTQAQGYRDEADGFADEAETHVGEAETAATQANAQADRAKSEADRAAELIANIPGKESINGFAKVYKNKADAVSDVNERTIGDKILVWEEENSVYSWYDITGTLDNKELTINSSEKKLKTVNNVQPDDSGNIQITLPGGNPSLWLGETVLFQYDPDKDVSYPGLLPQDGREVRRADYPDLWLSIAQNYIPSVSESEWQAGKTNCFSTGDGTTTFRVPKWSGEVLRTPNADDEKGEVVAQIPYVVTVNGVAPNDTTGNVQIDAVTTDGMNSAITTATFNKANKGANTDITSLGGISSGLTIRAMKVEEGTEGNGITIESADPVGASFGIANVGGGAAVFHNYAKPADSSGVLSDFLIGGYGSRPWTGSTYTAHSNTAIHFIMDGKASSTNHGGWARLLTCPKGSTQDGRRQTFATSNNGDLWVGYDVPMGINAMGHPYFNDNTQNWDGRGLKQIVNTTSEANFLAPAAGSTTPSVTIRGTPFGGTALSRSATPAGSSFWIGLDGHDGTNFTAVAAGMRFVPSSGQNWSPTNRGAGIIFATTPLGSTSRSDRFSMTGDGNFTPLSDGTQSLGLPSFRFSAVYAVNGAIQTSDARLKSQVREFTSQEILASKLLAKEIGFFSWLAKQEDEGDKAREHVGMTVQRAIEIMESCNLDPMNYGFICHDSWEERQMVDYYEDDTQDPVYKTIPAGDRYSFRYDQLNLFIAKGFEARLSVLEES